MVICRFRPKEMQLWRASLVLWQLTCWLSADVFKLRQEHRIVGSFAGCLSRAPRQDNFLGVPLVLSPAEIDLAVRALIELHASYMRRLTPENMFLMQSVPESIKCSLILTYIFWPSHQLKKNFAPDALSRHKRRWASKPKKIANKQYFRAKSPISTIAQVLSVPDGTVCSLILTVNSHGFSFFYSACQLPFSWNNCKILVPALSLNSKSAGWQFIF